MLLIRIDKGTAGVEGPAPHEPMYHEYQKKKGRTTRMTNENTSRSYEIMVSLVMMTVWCCDIDRKNNENVLHT